MRGAGGSPDRRAGGGVADLRRRPRPHPLRAPRPDHRRQLRGPRGRVAVPDRQPRSGAGVPLPVDAARGRRGALLHGGVAPGGGRPRRGDGRAAVGAPPRRGGARRRRPAPALGPRAGVLGRGRGGRAAAGGLRHPGLPAGRPRRRHRPPGPGVRAGRHGRPEAGQRPADRPGDRRGRPARHPHRRRRRRHRRRRPPHRGEPPEPGQREGLRARLRRAHRRAALDLPHHSPPRPVRSRHVARRLCRLHRQHRRVGADLGRRRAGARVPAGGGGDRRLLRGQPARRQPLRGEPRRGRPVHRRAPVALPARPPRHLGPRHPLRADPARRRHRRGDDQGGGPAHQAGVPVRLRPRDGRADLADRGAAGAGRRRPRRVVLADAAHPHPSRPPTTGRASPSTTSSTSPPSCGPRRSSGRRSTSSGPSSPRRWSASSTGPSAR